MSPTFQRAFAALHTRTVEAFGDDATQLMWWLPERREADQVAERTEYTAAVSCGAIYVVLGVFGAAITGVLTAFPKEMVAAIAGLALLGTIGSGLATALREESHREAALITFLVTLSGVVIAGVGSAFWGVVAGAIALVVQQFGRAR